MAQETLSLANEGSARSWRARWQGIGVQWKIAGIFVGVAALQGLFVVVRESIGGALRTQLDQRIRAIAANLSDAAAGHAVGKDLLSLHALATKYALLEGIAYTIIAV